MLGLNDCEVNFIFVSEKRIADLNRKYLDGSGPTDVISFLLDSDDKDCFPAADAGPWGEVYISPSICERQAEERGIPMEEEIVRLMAHGLLHLAGHDHLKDEDARRMVDLEEKLLAGGITRIKENVTRT